jgi:hypothetical protein
VTSLRRMAEREFWSVSRMFVGLLEHAEVEQLKERFAGLQAEVMPVSRGNRVMIELTIQAEDAVDASEWRSSYSSTCPAVDTWNQASAAPSR